LCGRRIGRRHTFPNIGTQFQFYDRSSLLWEESLLYLLLVQGDPRKKAEKMSDIVSWK